MGATDDECEGEVVGITDGEWEGEVVGAVKKSRRSSKCPDIYMRINRVSVE